MSPTMVVVAFVVAISLTMVVGEEEQDALLDLMSRRYHVDKVTLKEDGGQALLLTPLIEKQDFAAARAKSSVDPEVMANVKSHAGYITVDERYNSNLWFWYFPAEEVGTDQAPFVIWLQGGPGASSMYGLFEELGPFGVDQDGVNLIRNPHSWHRHHNILFIDNPVGTGFSFTDSEEGYARNQTTIGKHLYIFLGQFLRLFPELQKAPLYITGESYAGKHIPSFAYEIHKNNPTAELKINLKGLAIGNGFIDPASMTAYSSYFYQLGLIDDNQVKKVRQFEILCDAALASGNLKSAYVYYSNALGYAGGYSQIESIYNFGYEKLVPLQGPFTKFIQNANIRRALHVGNNQFAPLGKVYIKLRDDFMTSARTWLEELLEHYRIMVYSGQMDVIVAYPLSIRTYRSLKWSGSQQYLNATRIPWFIGNTAVGHTKTAGNLFEVFLRNAGHMVPTDQPERALFLIRSFINQTPLCNKPEGGIKNT